MGDDTWRNGQPPIALHLQRKERDEAERRFALEHRGVTRMANPPHRSHLCHNCGCVWRPADVATVGVKRTETQGKADTWPHERQTDGN